MRMLIKIIVVIILVMIAIMVARNNQKPKVLGVLNGKLAELPETPNAVSTQTSNTEKKVSPMPFKDSLDESKRKVKEAIATYGGAKIVSEEETYLHVVFSTGTMKFKDDAEFYFDISNNEIHFRSASRVGYSDMGLNRQRYETLREYYMK